MLRVGLIQMRTPADQAAALAQAEPLVRQAAANGARLIATPEGTNILQRRREPLFEKMATPEMMSPSSASPTWRGSWGSGC